VNSLIGFASNRIVTNYSIQSEILNICTALVYGLHLTVHQANGLLMIVR